MAIHFTCACGKQYDCQDDMAGHLYKCQGCGQTVWIPAASPSPGPGSKDALARQALASVVQSSRSSTRLPPLLENSPATIAAAYDWDFLILRWAAACLDMIILFCIIVAMHAVSKTVGCFGIILCLAIFVLYYPLFECLCGQSMGKIVCRIRVVDAYGRNPSLKQAIVRTLWRLVEVNPLLLGGFPAGIVVLTSKKRQRIGDMFADTCVLRATDVARISQQSPSSRDVPSTDG